MVVFSEFTASQVAKIIRKINSFFIAIIQHPCGMDPRLDGDKMSNETHNAGTLYHIHVKGKLDLKWADWFDGLALTWSDKDETVLSGVVADQATLHGILNKINRLGLFLILVAHIEDDDHCSICGGFNYKSQSSE